ncbi:uncharacterized protein LOC105664181 [Megachile rotundata]|uniref:uncharacterized protein LOC105664181 n=1 Tax=Megachile rotundata TaxID=143995 RepID=UPI000614B25A|nr:PREDICTED: uncharacterized protein LOC105664181 [Megachile rotundata]XP_012152982.1 PREDICTED: uncharacterized protein LOC105664181 [Megachile rotundata]XP_012152983.1 PREDICTED: uncharacterized protein LOC105664181 [Megachile rotundata]
MAKYTLRRIIKRYWAVTFFPAFAAITIYADWNHTRQWKKKLAEQGKLYINN